jgi:hypothetical protein
MALECSHIRFALDIKDVFGVQDMEKYISGSIYPDSRYVTGFERPLTHNNDYLSKDFWAEDDYKKGWVAHLLLDLTQKAIFNDVFKDLLGTQNIEQGNDTWVKRSGLKVLQDMDDFTKFDLEKHLPYLKYYEASNNEPAEDMKKYYETVARMYAGKDKVTIQDSVALVTGWGLDPELAKQVGASAVKLEQDSFVKENIVKVYDQALALFREEYLEKLK